MATNLATLPGKKVAPKKANLTVLLPRELEELLTTEELLNLIERYAGIRLFIPKGNQPSKLIDELGDAVVRKLSEHYGGLYLRVPLMRHYLCAYYSSQGFSNAFIARKLRVTESAVGRMIVALRAEGKIRS